MNEVEIAGKMNRTKHYSYLSDEEKNMRHLGEKSAIRSTVLCLVTQSCPTLWDPMDCSSPGSSAHGLSKQEHWNGLSCPPPGDLPKPGIKPRSPTLQADSLPSESPEK